MELSSEIKQWLLRDMTGETIEEVYLQGVCYREAH